MSNGIYGAQAIGCRVSSCRYHSGSDNACELEHIDVEPICGEHTGEACDESMCGSYRTK